tara:strand:- start:49 stop:396 length:348 start_codon:yes stop_codon:yes gene_type:complete
MIKLKSLLNERIKHNVSLEKALKTKDSYDWKNTDFYVYELMDKKPRKPVYFITDKTVLYNFYSSFDLRKVDRIYTKMLDAKFLKRFWQPYRPQIVKATYPPKNPRKDDYDFKYLT